MTCPHSLRSDAQRAESCSQCLGIAVERIVPVDSVDVITAITAAPKPRRGRRKLSPAARARQSRERAARAVWQRNSTLITAPRSP